MNLKGVANVVGFAAATAFSIFAYAQPNLPDSPTITKPEDLKWTPLPIFPGVMVVNIEGHSSRPGPFMNRTKMPPGFKIGPHTHPGIEHITVMSGTYYLGHGDKFDELKLTDIPAGGVYVSREGVPHFGMVKEETVIQVHGIGPWGVTFVNPEDNPVKKQ